MDYIPNRLMSEVEREASMTHALGQWNRSDDLWVFAYGSLIWNPGFRHLERRPGTVRGYHRDLCLWSKVHRGTPESPGLVFGLDRGGACRGIAYRVAHDDVTETFRELWAREMVSGSYQPKWLTCHTPTGPVSTLAFVMDRQSPDYAGTLCDVGRLTAVRNGHGHRGPCSEYVLNTVLALRENGIRDTRLEQFAVALSA